MNLVLKVSAVFGAMALLAGCASNYDVEKVSMMPDQGGGFTMALHKRYVERAQFEKGEEDWVSVSFFNSRGKMAAMGDAPDLQMTDKRSLKADMNSINMAYITLAKALNTAAPNHAPDACARAQTWFEHWMEQAEEGHQPDHIATARTGFEKAMPDCKVSMVMPMDKKMPMKMASLPAPITIYFGHDSAEVTSASQSIIDRAAKAAKMAKAKRAVLIGHTDRSGSNGYNLALSQKRAEAVASALMMAGVPSAEIRSSNAGETSPQVSTEDGIKERMNRRVEVLFER
ncbi:MAG: OmpA family protein [Magnetovibrio sp.]|nr:OmpA family protein [Magnetovibrio sp.]